MTEYFSASYVLARQRFRDAAARLGWSQTAHPVGARGPEAEDLTIDVAVSGPDQRSRALIVSSGLHGVEGFFGSALQLAALSTMAGTLADRRLRVVLIHALNPFGFAWLRRVNEDNVDLNRNFLLPGDAFSGAPAGYAALDGLLNPRRPPRVTDRYPPAALPVLMRHGFPALRQAVAGGQYDFPKGLFFGGHGASRTQTLLLQEWPRLLDGCKVALHLDLHTGLGRWGAATAYADAPLTAAWRQRLGNGLVASRLVAPDLGTPEYVARGSLPQWAERHSTQTDYLGLTVDIGTYHALRVIAGLRQENQAHHWGVPDTGATLRARRHLRHLFCPPSAQWRRLALHDGLAILQAGVDILTST